MIQVRKSRYRGADGWLLCGTPSPHHWSLSVFFEHETAARRTAERIRANPDTYEIDSEDFEP